MKAMHLTEGSFEGIVHIKSPVIYLNQGHIFQTDGEINVRKGKNCRLDDDVRIAM